MSDGLSLAKVGTLAKLLIEKGLITEAEFMQKSSAERAGYQAMKDIPSWDGVLKFVFNLDTELDQNPHDPSKM